LILDILVFTLGLLVAGLLALAALPAIWRRALRLSGERLSRLVPLSEQEIAADRDHLRAAHAVDLRRTEQKLEHAEAERAALMAELPRRDARILALDREATRAQVEIAALQAEGARLQRELSGYQAESGAVAIALHGTTELAEKRWLDLAELEAERQRLEEQIDSHRGTMAALETRLLGATSRNEDLDRSLEQARQEAAGAVQRAATVEAERDGARDAAGALAARRDDLEVLLRARDRSVEALTAELAAMAERATEAERRVMETGKGLDRVNAERADLQVRHDALDAARAAAAEVARDDERRRAALVEELRADKAALGAALATARAEAEKLRAALAGSAHAATGARQDGAEPEVDDLGRLRAAIDHLAEDVLRVVGKTPAEPAGEVMERSSL